MKKILLFSICLIAICLLTCRKESTSRVKKFPFTGNYDDTSIQIIPLQYTYSKYQPHSCYEYYGEDSFKSLDSTYHIYMQSVYYAKKKFDSCCGLIKCQPDYPQHMALKFTNQEVQICTDEYTVVNENYFMINKLYRNTQIDASLFYTSEKSFFYNSYSPNIGDWNKTTNEKKYLGIRKKYLGDYKYGWIQISIKNGFVSLDTMVLQK